MCHSTSRHSLDGSGLGSEGVWSSGASDHGTRIRHVLEVSCGSTLAPPVFWVAAAAATTLSILFNTRESMPGPAACTLARIQFSSASMIFRCIFVCPLLLCTLASKLLSVSIVSISNFFFSAALAARSVASRSSVAARSCLTAASFRFTALYSAGWLRKATTKSLIALNIVGAGGNEGGSSFDGSEVFAPSYCAHAPPSSDAPPLSASSMV
mmetsp:Transcript_16767/g.41294  ORF Transcript_16767/g.41294 Transcript_16767/m.41294 type:complete len:211 (-) Transcript_16767:79-711(-)